MFLMVSRAVESEGLQQPASSEDQSLREVASSGDKDCEILVEAMETNGQLRATYQLEDFSPKFRRTLGLR